MEALAIDKESAHRAANYAYREAQEIIARGKQAVITAKEYEDDRSLQQNAYYWSVFLPQVSAQATILGQRWTVDAWHELGKRQLLGFEVKKVHVAGRKKPTIIRRLRSTTGLTVKQFAKYQEEFTAFAATDLGVVFPEEQR